MQPHCPKKGTTKAGQLALGQWATKEGCTTNKGPMKRGLPGNKQKQSSKNKRKRKKKDWKKKRTKRKKQEDEEKEKREAEKAEKEKPRVKEEDKKEEKTTLAQRVGPNPAKGVQEVQISSGESMSTSEDMSSSEDSMDNRDSRANQKGRGQTPKLEFGPSRLEVVKEEQAARNKAAAKKKPEEKASSSSSRGPAAMDTSLDQREDPATSLDKRDKPQIAIDHHNVLEVKGHIYPQSIRCLDRLRQLGYKVHLVSYCGENRWRQVHSEALGAWDGWESMTRTDQRCGPNGKVEYLLSQGISVLIDDTAEILQEALLKGIKVYPVTTPHEKHMWNRGNKPAGAAFCHRYLADAINCFILDENKRKKQWQVKN